MGNPSDEVVKKIFETSKTVAVVGLSDKAHRSSYGVTEYLSKHYSIVGINPRLTEWNGFPCYPSLAEIPQDTKIDIVDVFRRSEFIPEIVDEVIALKPKLLWLQQGVVHDEAAAQVRQAGIEVVMDSCLAVVHSQL